MCMQHRERVEEDYSKIGCRVLLRVIGTGVSALVQQTNLTRPETSSVDNIASSFGCARLTSGEMTEQRVDRVIKRGIEAFEIVEKWVQHTKIHGATNRALTARSAIRKWDHCCNALEMIKEQQYSEYKGFVKKAEKKRSSIEQVPVSSSNLELVYSTSIIFCLDPEK